MLKYTTASKSIYQTLLLTCLLLTFVCSCAVGGGEDKPQTNGESNFTLSATTNEKGIAAVSFGMPSGVTKFSVTAKTQKSTASVRYTQIKNSNGDDYLFPGGSSLSLGDTYGVAVKAINIPSRSVDRGVSNDLTYNITLQVIDSSGDQLAGETISVTVNGKNDPSLDSGSMTMNLFYVGDVGADPDTLTAVKTALNTTKAIFSGPGSISLRINEFSIEGPVVLPSPLNGSSIYQSASGMAPSPAVNIFIGGDIGGTGLGGGVLGFAADIPGPPFSSPRSVTAISIFENAGPDGIFSAQDARLLGETIAHESGHFMGLFHPIDFSGSSVAFTDPLADTPSCSFITECLSNSVLSHNLMYPSPVADGSGGFVNQNELTSNQGSVMNRYLAVD